MADKTWKAVERKIGAYLGTTRTPLSGGNGKQTRSDTLHPHLFVEVKHGKHIPKTWVAIERLFKQTAILAARENKIPVVVLHPKGRGGVPLYPSYVGALLPGGATIIIEVPLMQVKDFEEKGWPELKVGYCSF